MGNNYKESLRQSFKMVDETCPVVDDAFRVAIDVVKNQTRNLRDALCESIEKLLDAEDKIKELEERIKELEGELEHREC